MNEGFLKRIHPGIRWALFFPAAVIGMLAGTFLYNTLTAWGLAYQDIREGSFWYLLQMNTVGSAISSACFVYTGALVVPKSKETVSIVLGILAMILALVGIVISLIAQLDGFLWSILAGIFFMIGAGVTIYSVHEESGNL